MIVTNQLTLKSTRPEDLEQHTSILVPWCIFFFSVHKLHKPIFFFPFYSWELEAEEFFFFIIQ